jgi:fimbrial chaperone protein
MLAFHPRWLIACSLLPVFSVCAAGSMPLAVAPVTIKMDLVTEFSAVEVSNRGDQATGIEIEMVRVKWVDGQEQYEATADFIVSPAAFRLAATKSRMVRFRYAGARHDTEGFYRLFIRQLPEALPDNQINMVFNLGVPVFIAPLTARPGLALASPSTGSAVSELRNTGNVTLNLFTLEGASCPEGAPALLGRIAPDQKRKLKGNLSQCATGVRTDHGLIPLTRP